MTVRKYTSRSQQTTLSSAVTSGATVIPVTNASTLLAGTTISAGQTFVVVIDPDTALEEIVEITSASSNNLTVTRAVDMSGASAQDHSSGAVVRHMIIGRDLRESNLHIEATGAYNDGTGTHAMHGLGASDGVVVGTDATQTLTNKTLTAPILTGAGVDASIVFEGSTADAFETTLTVVDPTQDNTITLPNTTGTVAILTATQTMTNKTLTSPIISGSPVITGLSSAGMSASSAAPKDYVDSILGSATAASTSAASAATSASSAATSATSSATSASAALTSANSAASSATAAATSAASALTSQTAAATSATSAAASATAAATSATSAAASASAAATSATSAAASATTAANSVASILSAATSASNSASAAATSATSAAASATAAATSASSAATSASSALANQTAAATSATSAAASATAAATSETNAATSASSALTSQTAAATSAASALTSQTAAATSATSALASQTAAATSATSAATSASSAATSATDAATTYDQFDDRYLGSKSIAPTVDNDGNTLLVGALYWNSTLNNMYVWSGSVWVQMATTTVYTAPTIGTTTIGSGATVSTITALTLSGGLADANPTTNLGLATKQYVDAVVTQINYHEAVTAASTNNLGVTYSNGSSGVGATLTADTLRAFNTLDGASVSVGQRVLIKNQTNQIQNGIYTLTNNGSAGVTAWVLTRATDADNNPTGEMKNGDELYCTNGTVNSGKSFINSTATDPIVIGTTSITFSEYYASLPAQTGNSGKYLTTDGTTPSWGTVANPAATPTTLGTVYGATVIASGLTSLGHDTYVTANNATAIGGGAAITGINSTAIGYGSGTGGTSSVALGTGAGTTGNDSIAIGANTITVGSGSITLGKSAYVTQDASIALGNSAQTTANKQIVIGATAGTPTEITRFTIPGMDIDWNKNIEIMNIMGAY